MHLGLLTQERLSFDPIKPLILRGSPSENSTSIFTGTVVLSLSKATKISKVTVTFKSTATTYWPEGIGARGTRLSFEKVLTEESVQLLDLKKTENIKLGAGIHRFSFAFVVPNSIVETIEDIYGRVRHTIDAKVIPSGIQLLSNWHISRPVLVLRTYMSDALLTNNSLQDLSRTYEKHLPAADIQLVVDRAAFSSGDLFYLKLIMQPQRKQVRLEHMEITVTETRRYQLAEMNANRNDSVQYVLHFLQAINLDEESDGESICNLKSVFMKKGNGIDLKSTLAYKIVLATPTCSKNIHHTTYYRDILFKHHLNISMTISFVDEQLTEEMNKRAKLGMNLNSTNNSFADISGCSNNSSSDCLVIEQQSAEQVTTHIRPPPVAFSSSSHINVHSRHNFSPSADSSANQPIVGYISSNSHANSSQTNLQSTWISKLKKPINMKEGGSHVIRKRETIRLETPITVFDCRLKEDYGRLPSYSELNVASCHTHGDNKSRMTSDLLEHESMLQCMMDSDKPLPFKDAQPQLCPCYMKFRQQVEMASQAQLASTHNECGYSLEKVPSLPPPDYVDAMP